jgi:hypothetical protein
MKFGILSGQMESFLHIGLFDKSKGGQTLQEAFRNELSLFAGLNYFIDNMIFYGTAKSDGYEYRRSSDGALFRDHNMLGFKLGGGQNYQMDEASKIFVDIHYYREFIKEHENIVAGTGKVKTEVWRIPFTLGVESKVLSWLTLRGSIAQNLFSSQTNRDQRKKSERNTTSVNAGATLELGKMKLDGLVGMMDGTGNNNKRGVLGTSNLLSRVSLSYWF